MPTRKRLPYEFVIDALAPVQIRTNPMFGSTAIYVDDKIVLILRERESSPVDNGVWVATTVEHHASLRKDLPSIRSIEMFSDGRGLTGWQVLPADSPKFESEVQRACELIIERDERIGKVPKGRKSARPRIAKRKR